MSDLLEIYEQQIHEPQNQYKVICTHCGEHIYTMDHELELFSAIRAQDFLPARPEIPYPVAMQKMDCPLCHQFFMTPSCLLKTQPVYED